MTWSSPVLRRTAPTVYPFPDHQSKGTTGQWRLTISHRWYREAQFLVGLEARRNSYTRELRANGWRTHRVTVGFGHWQWSVVFGWTDSEAAPFR